MRKILLIFCAFVLAVACNKDEVITTAPAPRITLDSPSGIYLVKVGRELTIAPEYENAEGAEFEWAVEGRDVCHAACYTFTPTDVGQIFITLTVVTQWGRDSVEMRVDVVEREIPTVMLAGVDAEEDFGGFFVAKGKTMEFVPTVRECSIPTLCSWWIDGEKASEEVAYTFSATELGDYRLRFEAANEDGSDAVEFDLHVVEADEMPFSWEFAQILFRLSSGRQILIEPSGMENATAATFSWSIDSVPVEGATSPQLTFDKTAEGRYAVTVTATGGEGMNKFTLSQNLIVEVCPAEGTYRREKSSASLAVASAVFEYTPAPGQFINESRMGFSGAETSPRAAAEYAASRLEKGAVVSLGGFGGYIVVGFDHSVENGEGCDFAIGDNAIENSSEPGIVWVMQDENGDGLPNDTWYELRGSEEGKSGTLKSYSVTYYRPAAEGMAVPWRDSSGACGAIDYLASEHSQPSYYPEWIVSDSYTLRGTRLEARNYDLSGDGTYWVQPACEWGYADNFGSVDRLSDDQGTANCFDIANAIDWQGRAVELAYIDFVKVQTALNTKSDWLGENSTEVTRFFDLSIPSK